MHKAFRAAFPLLAAASGLAAPQSRAADDELGAFLAETCAACHQSGVRDSAIPSIAGLDETRFVSLIQAYRSGTRADPIMQAVANSLSDEETAALADHLANQGRPQ